MNHLNIALMNLLLFALAGARPDKVARLDQVTSTPTPLPEESWSNQGTVEDRTRLVHDLFIGYNKNVNPDGVTLKVGLHLMDFSIDGKKSTVYVKFWSRYVWNDARLQWDPEHYGNVSVLRYPSSEVWTPDITMYYSASENHLSCWNTQVLMYPNGEILHIPPCLGTSTCPGMSLYKHPYGEHLCTLQFGSWTYDGSNVGLQLYNNQTEMDFEYLTNTSGFEIVSNHAEVVNQKYSCCQETYPYVRFTFTVKRIPGAELYNL